ncbi:MAG: hypothetical protein ACE14S_04695 [Candidatus Bathyarchaeia archaeon]
MARKEVFEWIRDGSKTIDVRKGKAWKGDVAVCQSGRHHLRLRIVKKETGQLRDIVRQSNFRRVVPSAETVEDALRYLRDLYGTDDGFFTAYYLHKTTSFEIQS